MANPSAIFTTGQANDSRLFYQNPQGQYSQIANTNQLQDLAKQGLVQVGGQRQTLPQGSVPGMTSPTPTSSPSTQMPGVNDLTPTTTPTTNNGLGSLEVKPGVYSSSKLTDYYNTDIERNRPAYEQAQSSLANINTKLSELYSAPSLQQSFNDQYTKAIGSIDSTLAQRTNDLNGLQQAIAGVEEEVRSRIGGQAPEAYIRAEIAKRSEPLIKQQQVLVDNINLLQNQRQQALQGVERSIGFAQQDRQNQLSGLQAQYGLAKDTINAFNTLQEKGADATAKERDDARQLFSSLLQNSPEFLRSLTQDELNQIQQGVVPYSALSKIETIKENQYQSGSIGEYQFYADQEKAAGRTPMGYDAWLTADANRKNTTANAPTPVQILNRATQIQQLASDNGQTVDINAAIAQARNEFATLSGGGYSGSSGYPSPGATTGSNAGSGGNQDFQGALGSFMQAIAKQESGGRYNAVGPKTSTGDQAYGKYQVMGANIPTWTKQALGVSMTPQQFLASPGAQEAVASAKFQEVFNKYGNWQDVASVWFSGRPLSGNRSKDVTGTSVPQYVANISSTMQKAGFDPKGTGLAATTAKPSNQNTATFERVPGTFVPKEPVQNSQFTPQFYATKLGQKTLDNESQAQGRFLNNQTVKEFNVVMDQVSSAKSIIDSGVGGPQDLALVYSFMKALDPSSVVRETEYDAAAKSGNLFQGMFSKFNGYFKENGGTLPDNVKQEFIKIMNARLEAKWKKYNTFAKQQRATAKNQGLNPDNVALEYEYVPEKSGSSGSSSSDPLGLGLGSKPSNSRDPLGLGI